MAQASDAFVHVNALKEKIRIAVNDYAKETATFPVCISVRYWLGNEGFPTVEFVSDIQIDFRSDPL